MEVYVVFPLHMPPKLAVPLSSPRPEPSPAGCGETIPLLPKLWQAVAQATALQIGEIS